MNMNPWLIWDEDPIEFAKDGRVALGWTEWAVGDGQREWNAVPGFEGGLAQEVKKSDVMIGIYRQNRGFEPGDKCTVSFMTMFTSDFGIPTLAVGIDREGRTEFSEEELSEIVKLWEFKTPKNSQDQEWTGGQPVEFSYEFTAENWAQTIFLAVDLNGVKDGAVWLDQVKLELETDRRLPEWVRDGSPPVEPPYIYGIHDAGAEHLFNEHPKKRQGWIVVRAKDVDADRVRFYQWVDGHGVIVRLDDFGGGDIPKNPKDYDEFAQRCANFVEKSIGAGIWSIGNEPKINSGATPEQYALCYCKCRAAIKKVRPGAQVITGGMMHGDVAYFKGFIKAIQDLMASGQCEGIDGFAIHSYTDARYWNPDAFGEYVNSMEQIPRDMRHLPVYMTEAGTGSPGDPSENMHLIDNMFRHVHDWNQRSDTQKIRSVNFFRWRKYKDPSGEEYPWGIEHNPGMIKDFLSALDNEYFWKQP